MDEASHMNREALADSNRCEHEIFACGLLRGHQGKHSTIVSVRSEAADLPKHSHGRDCCWECFHGPDSHPKEPNDAACEYEGCPGLA